MSERYHIDWSAFHRRARSGPCFVCEIAAGNPDYPAHMIYEDDIALAFLDKYPILYGHVLVASREHREQVTGDFTADEYLDLQRIVYRVTEAVREEVKPERVYVFTLGSQQGNVHVHWHVVPLPPGVPYHKQQVAILRRSEVGILNMTGEAKDLLASRIHQTSLSLGGYRRAFQSLTGAKYSRMRRYRLSPPHLEPVEVDGRFGYRHRSEEHDENDSWVQDVVDRAHAKDIDQQEDKILLLPGVKHQKVLTIDCCYLCKNIFYARGSGLPISDDIFSVLRAAQPGKEIDEYAIFGRQQDGKANGLRAMYCEITDPTQIQRLIEAKKMLAVSVRGFFDEEGEGKVISCLRGCRD